jgi:hypothetical protein
LGRNWGRVPIYKCDVTGVLLLRLKKHKKDKYLKELLKSSYVTEGCNRLYGKSLGAGTSNLVDVTKDGFIFYQVPHGLEEKRCSGL